MSADAATCATRNLLSFAVRYKCAMQRCLMALQQPATQSLKYTGKNKVVDIAQVAHILSE